MYLRFFSGVVFLFASYMVVGQEPAAMVNTRPFPPVVREVFGSFDCHQRGRAIALADSVQEAWLNRSFSDSQKDTIAKAIERLFGGRFHPWNDTANYFRIILHISQQADAPQLFARWHQALAHSMQTQTTSRTGGFLERSKDHFLENLLFRSGSVSWKVRNSRPEYDFIGNESVVTINMADLICLSQNDSSIIYQTSGKVSLDRNILYGKGGKHTWKSALLDPERVFAILEQFKLDLTKASFEADSVSFFYLDYFENPLLGRIAERVVAEFNPENANYPDFESYQRQHVIKDVYPGKNYHGGFVLRGSRLHGAGNSDQAARIEIFKNGRKVIGLQSNNFVLRPDRLLSDRASFTLYLERDSIYHPNLTVRYLNQQREFMAMRNERANSMPPFSNTYHRIDMLCDALYWNLDSAFMTFQMISGIGKPGAAIFESHDFLSQARYDRAQGIDDISPLSRLSAYARMSGTHEFYLHEFGRFIRREPSSVKQSLIKLSNLVFVLFHDADNRLILTERLYHYLAANARMTDHNVIQNIGILNIDSGGEIQRLSNAYIIAGMAKHNHSFFNATVQITSARNYRGSGYYNYIDKNGESTPIYFEKIYVDNQQKSIGEASLPESFEFFLSPQFAFFGKTQLKAGDQFMTFYGYSKKNIPCKGMENGWFRFNVPVNPSDIRIPVKPGIRNPDRRPVNVAIMLAGDSLRVYPAIFIKPGHYLDRELFSAHGYLIYDDHAGDFIISLPEKLNNRDLHHNLLRIDSRNCVISGEGKINLGVDLGQFKTENFGTLVHNMQSNVTDLDIVMGLNFFFSDRILNTFLAGIDKGENQHFNLNSLKFRTFLASKTNTETAAGAINSYLVSGSIKQLPKEIVQTIILGDVKLRWNQASPSFVSYGPIGLFSNGQHQVIRHLNGHLEVRKLRAGDTFTMLFRESAASGANIGRCWYYFNMGNNMLTVLSSVPEFNGAVRRIRPNQRQIKPTAGEPPFSFDLAAERRPYDFFQVMRQIGIY